MTTPLVMAFFGLVKPQIEKNITRYENGKKGGRPLTKKDGKKTKAKPKETKPEPNYNVNYNVNDNVNVIKKEIRKEDINLDVMEVIKALKPSADELTQICNDYKNNQTMLRLIREYIHANSIGGVIIPAINADRVTALNRICDNLKGCAKVAADYNSPLHTRQFEHIANNFDSVFEKDLAIID